MERPTIVITEFMDEAAVASLAAHHPTVYDPALVDDPARLAAFLGAARALIVRNRTEVRPALLDAAPRLEVVGRLGVGLDNIDVDACKARSISVHPATGANSASVAEYVIAAILVLARRGAYQASAEVAAGSWPRNRLIGGEAGGKVLGLVGFGGIAREVARRATVLGMTVKAYDPFLPADHAAWSEAERSDLDGVVTGSDFLSLHVPLTAETRHLIGTDSIARMRPGAVVINTSRGGVVDDGALAAAIRAGTLGGAALDVFETEPLTAAAGAAFAGLPNVILTPHIAGVTAESNVRVSTLIARVVLDRLG